MCKLLLTVIGHVMACVMDDPQQLPPQQTDCGAPNVNGCGDLGLCFSSTNSVPTSSSRSPVAVLRQALHSIPNQNTEYMLRSVASKLAQNLAEQVCISGLAFIIPHMYSGVFHV
jgi:ubiquitin carboxyl-terminal hydrolase 9/24